MIKVMITSDINANLDYIEKFVGVSLKLNSIYLLHEDKIKTYRIDDNNTYVTFDFTVGSLIRV